MHPGRASRSSVSVFTNWGPLPDVELLDNEKPGADGHTVAAELRQQRSACKAIILTTFGHPGYLRRAITSGAVGFLPKDSP